MHSTTVVIGVSERGSPRTNPCDFVGSITTLEGPLQDSHHNHDDVAAEKESSPLNELRVAVTMKMVPRTPPSTEPGRQQVSRLQRSHLHSAAIAEFFAFVLSQVVAALGVGEGLVSEGPFAFY